jgi:alpha-beta hydrolase superfamily lysophospholipase
VTHTELQLSAADGTPLHVERWTPDGEVRFVVVVAHGGAEHVGRYAWLSKALGEVGGLVVGPDHRGQGKSGGPRGHVERFEDYAADLRRVMERTAEDLPASQRPDALPWFVYGHSMGGLITLTYLLDHEKAIPLSGAIVSSPLLGLAMKVGAVKRFAGDVLAKLLPKVTLPTGIPPELICRDPEEVARYRADDRRVGVVSAGWFHALLRAIARVENEIEKVALPMRWAVGTGDGICDHEAMLRVFRSIDDAREHDQTLKIWEGYYHELHNEPEELRAPVWADYRDWILARL